MGRTVDRAGVVTYVPVRRLRPQGGCEVKLVSDRTLRVGVRGGWLSKRGIRRVLHGRARTEVTACHVGGSSCRTRHDVASCTAARAPVVKDGARRGACCRTGLVPLCAGPWRRDCLAVCAASKRKATGMLVSYLLHGWP